MAERTAERVSTRDWIIKALRRDLIGPSWKEGTTDPDLNETIEIPTTSNPTRKYLGGYLEPSRNRDQIRKDEIPETTPKPRIRTLPQTNRKTRNTTRQKAS